MTRSLRPAEVPAAVTVDGEVCTRAGRAALSSSAEVPAGVTVDGEVCTRAGRAALSSSAEVPAGVTVDGEAGSAVADFAMVSGLLSLLFLAVFQLGLALHIRNTLISCASEGARYGARANATPQDGAARATQLIRASLSDQFADHVTATNTTVDGVQVVQVRVQAPLPVLGPLGPDRVLSVQARAFSERQ